MYNGINKIRIHKTRIPELGYANTNPMGKPMWRVIDLQDGNEAEVGPQYATKAELLADFTRYAKSWGYNVD